MASAPASPKVLRDPLARRALPCAPPPAPLVNERTLNPLLAAARASPALLTALRAYAAAAEPAKQAVMENAMFCYQCEQTTKGTGCTTKGEGGAALERQPCRIPAGSAALPPAALAPPPRPRALAACSPACRRVRQDP